MKEIARLRIKLPYRDDVLEILSKGKIEIVAVEERGDGEARIEIPNEAASYEVLSSIPTEWWAIRGIIGRSPFEGPDA